MILLMDKKNLVILSGAGISAESGIATFRDSNGLWEGHDVMEVASPKGWSNNKKLVLDFYNKRRKNVIESEPNQAHLNLAELESNYNVQIITQNVDDLHERAGSSNVLHLHGEIRKSRSTADSNLIYTIDGANLNIGDKCENGSQLRPDIVWFGELVPAIEEAIPLVQNADIIIVIGTSMVVYPAAGLIDFVRTESEIFVIDPNMPSFQSRKKMTLIEEKGSVGMQIMVDNYL